MSTIPRLWPVAINFGSLLGFFMATQHSLASAISLEEVNGSSQLTKIGWWLRQVSVAEQFGGIDRFWSDEYNEKPVSGHNSYILLDFGQQSTLTNCFKQRNMTCTVQLGRKIVYRLLKSSTYIPHDARKGTAGHARPKQTQAQMSSS